MDDFICMLSNSPFSQLTWNLIAKTLQITLIHASKTLARHLQRCILGGIRQVKSNPATWTTQSHFVNFFGFDSQDKLKKVEGCVQCSL